MNLSPDRRDVKRYVTDLEEVVLRALAGLGIEASRSDRRERVTSVWVGNDKIAAIGVHLSRWITTHGFALNVTDEPLPHFAGIVPCGITDGGVTSIERCTGRRLRPEDRRGNRRGAFRRGLRPRDNRPVKTDLPVHGAAPRATRLDRPEWLKVRLSTTGEYEDVRRMMRRLSLVTVCEEARCPNIHECWARERTATFMLLGDVCTRHCGFCAVGKGRPGALDPEEPGRVAEAAAELGLSHAVVTSVNRDDLPDGGAAHFAETIRAIRDAQSADCTVEVLIPDFQGDPDALETVLDAAPEILNHNMETVRAALPPRPPRRGLRAVARRCSGRPPGAATATASRCGRSPA